MKCYRNITTDEVVYKEEAEEYVLNRLGITVTPKGENGEMNAEGAEMQQPDFQQQQPNESSIRRGEKLEEKSLFSNDFVLVDGSDN